MINWNHGTGALTCLKQFVGCLIMMSSILSSRNTRSLHHSGNVVCGSLQQCCYCGCSILLQFLLLFFFVWMLYTTVLCSLIFLSLWPEEAGKCRLLPQQSTITIQKRKTWRSKGSKVPCMEVSCIFTGANSGASASHRCLGSVLSTFLNDYFFFTSYGLIFCPSSIQTSRKTIEKSVRIKTRVKLGMKCVWKLA